MSQMTPREIVSELDRYIVGQRNAKRAVAVALRNRWRRQQVPEELRDEIAPKNIIMIGPTGVGKTEISRRLAKLAQAPFIKVEASKFTEVGYVGRDVESIIRDLTDLAVKMVKDEEQQKVALQARDLAEERVLDLLLPPARNAERRVQPVGEVGAPEAGEESATATRDKLRRMMREGKLDDRVVELEVTKAAMPMVEVLTPQGMEEMEFHLKDLFSNLMPKKTKKQRLKIPEALTILAQEEAGKLVDMEVVTREAIRRVEQSGIVFIDEIDKIAGRESVVGPDVSRQGVQRDLLPIVEGQHRQYQVRHGAHGPHPVHRVGGLSQRQAVGSDPGVPRAVSDPRRIGGVDAGGLHPHPHRAAERPASNSTSRSCAPKVWISRSRRTPLRRSLPLPRR